jgi:type IV secretory pathway VirB10-like protein
MKLAPASEGDVTELSPRARALVEASRKALRATAADRQRVEQALQKQLGLGAMSPAVSGVRPAGRGSWKLPTAAVGGVGLLCAAFFAMSPTQKTQPVGKAPTVSSQQLLPALEAPNTDPPLIAAAIPAPSDQRSTQGTLPPPAAVPSKRPAVRDRLSVEVELLSRATSALRAGDATAALKTLEEHQRRFPSGLLREERRIAKAQALCSLDRQSEGRAELLLIRPGTPGAARARQSCEP